MELRDYSESEFLGIGDIECPMGLLTLLLLIVFVVITVLHLL